MMFEDEDETYVENDRESGCIPFMLGVAFGVILVAIILYLRG